MIGLVKKDLILLKKDVILNLIMFLSVSYLLKNSVYLSALWVSLQVLSMVIVTFTEDTKSNFFAYISVFPNGKGKIVKNKYILFLVSFVISIILNSCMRIIANNSYSIDDALLVTFLSFIVSTILFSIVVPFIFKFEKDRGILILFISILFFFVLFVLISQFVDYEKFEILRKLAISFEFSNLNYGIGLIASLLIMFISFILSLRIVKSKEF